jgi:hypothetical protein
VRRAHGADRSRCDEQGDREDEDQRTAATEARSQGGGLAGADAIAEALERELQRGGLERAVGRTAQRGDERDERVVREVAAGFGWRLRLGHTGHMSRRALPLQPGVGGSDRTGDDEDD